MKTLNGLELLTRRIKMYGTLYGVMVVLAISAQSGRASGDRNIVPGRRIGALALGMTSHQALRVMGKAQQVRRRSAGVVQLSWWPPRQESSSGPWLETDALFRHDRMIQVSTSDPKFRQANGLSSRSLLLQIFAERRAVGQLKLKPVAYDVSDEGDSGYEDYIYDDVAQGIAYAVGAQDDFDDTVTISEIVVHRTGVAALPPMLATRSHGTSSYKPQGVGDPFNAEPQDATDGIFPATATHRLTRAEAMRLSRSNLSLAINELYARHGLTFKDKTTQARFAAQAWYVPHPERTVADVLRRMSAIERDNMKLLAQERQRRG